MHDSSRITDDAMVVEDYGNHEVWLYEGSYKNIKITTPEDFYTMRALLEAKENAQIYSFESR